MIKWRLLSRGAFAEKLEIQQQRRQRFRPLSCHEEKKLVHDAVRVRHLLLEDQED